jgi:predicted AAA+ superfamily ATPase
LGLAETMGQMQLVIDEDALFSKHEYETELISRLHDVPSDVAKEVFEQLMIFGGFPEPFLKANNRFSNKWRRDYKSLLRLVYRWNELGLGDFELRYVRNQQGKEVDFLIIKDQKPHALFEVKNSESKPSRSGTYFQKQLQVPYYQLVGSFDGVETWPNHQFIIAAWRLLSLVG